MTTYKITDNTKFNSKEIFFSGVPAKSTRDNLKKMGFRWHGQKRCWYGFATDQQIIEAVKEVIEIPEPVAVDPGTLYEGWQGGKNAEWHSDKELKALIMADLKKAGIRASIRFRNAGYLTSFTLTITIKSEMIKSFESWKEKYRNNLFNRSTYCWLPYMDENGKRTEIHQEKFWSLPEGPEKDELAENIKRTIYNDELRDLTGNTHGRADGLDILTDEGNELTNAVHKIVSSYNRDCSNSQVDYFDRDIYDFYGFKIA